MSDTEKDFYRILGVIDSAEIAVIKAAYKALMMIYHPDRYNGNKEEAVRKSKDINEAYAVLIDPDKRKKYDDERSARKNQYEPEPEQEEKTSSKFKDDVLEADWSIAIDHVTELDDLYKELYQLSPDVAFTFKLELLETKKFSDVETIASELKTEFLNKYFGTDEDIHDFAQWLLKTGHRDAAKELNKIITVIGGDLNARTSINKLIIKYELNYNKKRFDPYSTESDTDKKSIYILFSIILIFLIISVILGATSP